MSISSSIGTPVRSASWAKVTPLSAENRSKRGRVEEVERHLAAPDGGAEALQRDARRGEAIDERRPAEVARREPAVGVGREDAQLDEAVQLIDADATPFRGLGQVVRLHDVLYAARQRA